MSEKETSEEIASIAGRVMNMEVSDGTRISLGDYRGLLQLAKRLAGSALSQREEPEGDCQDEALEPSPLNHDINFGDPNFMRVWDCKIGFIQTKDLPSGSDMPYRRAVQEAFKKMTGRNPDFLFSGWGATLTTSELECIETDCDGVRTPTGYPYGE